MRGVLSGPGIPAALIVQPIQCAQAYYEKRGAEWVPPEQNPLAERYKDNRWYQDVLTRRSRDIVLAEDKFNPLNSDSETEQGLELCLH